VGEKEKLRGFTVKIVSWKRGYTSTRRFWKRVLQGGKGKQLWEGVIKNPPRVAGERGGEDL